MNQPDLGKKIAELRKAKGFTQEELVEQCNLNVRTLQRIESGEVMPRSYTLKVIFEALDYEVNNSSELNAYGSFNVRFVMKDWIERCREYVIDLFNLKTNTMKKVSILSVTTVVLFLLMFSVCSNISAKKSVAEAKSAIEQYNKNFIRWFNAGQIDSIMPQYREDACIVSKGCGKEFIYNNYKTDAARYKFLEIKTISLSVSDTIAVEKGKWVLKMNDSDLVVAGEYFIEWRLTNNKWLTVNEMSAAY